MGDVMQDLRHPATRPGGEWILAVMLVVVLAVLLGGLVWGIRHLAANPPELALPVPAEPPSS